MIKAEAIIVGTITQATQIKSNSQNGNYYSASVKSAIPQKEGGVKEVFIFITAPATASAGIEQLSVNQHVSLKGTLYFRKEGDQIYLNMSVKECTPLDTNPGDSISGNLAMIGVVGSKAPEVKNGKNGKPFMTFSAYSGDGDKDNRVFTWVRFTRFNGEVEPFLVPKALVQATGSLELQFFNDKLSISCRLGEVKPYIKKAPAEAPF